MMRIKNCPMVSLVGLFLALTMLPAARGAENTGKEKWDLKVIDQRGPFRTADTSAPLGKTVESQILGGPGNGSEDSYLIYTKMPAGSHGPKMFTLPVDHMYMVLSGTMTIQIGTDKFEAGPDTGIMIPAGVPHETWNAGSDVETNIEVIAPAPSLDLLSMLKPATARKIENAAQYVRKAPPLPATLRAGLNPQPFFSLALTNTPNQMRIDSTPAGSGNANPHIHSFEQVYYVKEGTMTLLFGLDHNGEIRTYRVPANSFVVIPMGVVHGNKNDGPGVERHVVFLLPENPASVGPLDVGIALKPIPPPRNP